MSSWKWGPKRIIAVNVIPTPERIRYWLDCQREPNGHEPRPSAFGRFFHKHFDYGAHGNILDTMMCAINGAPKPAWRKASRARPTWSCRPLATTPCGTISRARKKYIALGRAAAEAQLAELRATHQSHSL